MKTILKETLVSILATLVLAVVLCGVYPLVVYGLGKLLFSHQANGSLIKSADGTIIGSEWLGQSFSGAKYFHPRPSQAGTGYDASNSSGSNLGPTSKKLVNGTTKSVSGGPDVVDSDGIKLRILGYCEDNNIPYELLQGDKPADAKAYKTAKGEWDQVKLITAFNDDANPATIPLTIKAGQLIPADAVTSSGSGLDPHISVKNARLQAARVAKERSLAVEVVNQQIDKATAGRQFGILGEAGVNVLTLNLALDKLTSK